MSCKVTVTGEHKEKFDRLNAKFGQVIALENIYDSDGSSSIEGFSSDVEIANRVNGITFSVFNLLIKQTGSTSSLDLNQRDLDMREMDKALESAKSDLEQIVSDSIRKYEAEENQSINAGKAQRALVAYKSFEHLRPKILDRLRGFGLQFSNDYSEFDTTAEEDFETETVRDHIYSMSNTESSRLDSISPQVKLYLATLPKSSTKEIDGHIAVSEDVDDIGMTIPADFNETYSMLMKVLSNSDSMETMLARLQDLAEISPTASMIYEDITMNTMESNIPVKYNGKTVKNFENAFFTSFKNNFYNFTTVTYDKVVKMVDGERMVQNVLNVINTNRRRLNNQLKTSWMQGNQLLYKLDKNTKRDIWNAVDNGYRLSTFFGTKGSASRVKMLNNSRNKDILHELSAHLKSTGLNISVEALVNLRKQKNKYKDKQAFGKWILTDSNSLRKSMQEFWNKGKNPFPEENTLLNSLSRAEAEVSHDRTGGTFMNGENNMVYPFNLPTAATELFDELINRGKRLTDFSSDPLMSSFKLLKRFRSSNPGIEMNNFDTIYNNEKGSGVSYGSLDPTTSMAARMSLFMNYGKNGKSHGKKSWLMVPTPADRSGTRILKMDRVKNTNWSILGLEEGEFKNWLLATAKSELERIKLVREEFYTAQNSGDKSKLVKSYHQVKGELGNGGYFNYYPELNNLLEDGKMPDIDMDSPAIIETLIASARLQIEADITHLRKVGVLEDTGGFDNLKLTEFAKTILPGMSKASIYSFLANSIVVTHELSTMFNGDLAFFASGDFSAKGSQQSQFSSANKRAGLSDTPGAKLRIGSNGSKSEFKVAFVTDPEHSSEFLTDYTKALGEKTGYKYGRIEVTDGQGFMSIDRYADILKGMGQLTPSMIQTLEELKKPNPDWNKVTEVINPVKGFHQGQRFDPEFGRVMPKNLKYSLYPIIPSAIKDNSTMQHIHNNMEKSGIDETVFTSGAKFGAYNVNGVSDTEYGTVQLSNEDWRLPQVVPYKTKTKENFGSQIRKLIMGNLNMNAKYGSKTGTELQSDYQKAISLNMQDSLINLLKSLYEGGSPSIKKIANKVLEDQAKNAYKTTPDFIEQALQVIKLADDTLDTRIPMSFPALKHRVESSLNSAVRKAVTKQSLPGISAVLYSSVGFTKKQVKSDRALKFVRKDSKGNVLPAEVKVSPQYFIQSLLKQKNKSKEVISLINSLKEGNLDLSKFDPKTLEAVIYRIPTQGKNSALPIKIVGFTPEALGASIVVPSEITTQSGSDYDIDKVYVEMRHFDVVDNKLTAVPESMTSRQGRDNTIVNTHYSVLTSPESYNELITPNNSDTLDGLSERMSGIFFGDTEGSKWSSLSTQDDFRDKNQAGGIMIGIFSIANTAHALFQELGVKLQNRFHTEGVLVNGKEVASLSQVNNQQGGLISDDHMENQTAAVDNASNPVLGVLNINDYTGAVYNFLIESGAGINYAAKLVGSPIIRELTMLTRQYEMIYGSEGAFQEALKDITDDSKKFDMKVVSEKDFDISEAVLDDVITSVENGTYGGNNDGNILRAYLTFRAYGMDLVAVQQALQTDTVGAHQTLAANYIHMEKLARVQGTKSNELWDSDSENDTLEPIETITLDREKYKNHSMEAFEAHGLHGAIQIVSSVIDDTKPVQRGVMKSFQRKVGGRLFEKDLRLLMNDFYTYLYMNQDAHSTKTSPVADYLDSDTLAELLVGENSLGKRILEAQESEREKADGDVTYIPNEFLMSLTVVLGDKGTGYDLVNFNNTISRALSSEQKTTLSNELVRLQNSNQGLFMDTILYSFGMDGFSRSTNSYGDYIHASIYENISDESGSLVDFYRNIRTDFENHESFNTDDFELKFLQNRMDVLQGLKDLTKRKRKQIKEFLKSNPKVVYFKTTHNGKNVLAMSLQDKKGNYQIVANSLGSTNKQLEYQSGLPLSTLEDVRDSYDRANQSEDVKDNGKC